MLTLAQHTANKKQLHNTLKQQFKSYNPSSNCFITYFFHNSNNQCRFSFDQVTVAKRKLDLLFDQYNISKSPSALKDYNTAFNLYLNAAQQSTMLFKLAQ